jgi:hypothetical protein
VVALNEERKEIVSEPTFILDPKFWSSIELYTTERVDGDDLVLGGRLIERDRSGNIMRVSEHDNVRLIGGATAPMKAR